MALNVLCLDTEFLCGLEGDYHVLAIQVCVAFSRLRLKHQVKSVGRFLAIVLFSVKEKGQSLKKEINK